MLTDMLNKSGYNMWEIFKDETDWNEMPLLRREYGLCVICISELHDKCHERFRKIWVYCVDGVRTHDFVSHGIEI